MAFPHRNCSPDQRSVSLLCFTFLVLDLLTRLTFLTHCRYLVLSAPFRPLWIMLSYIFSSVLSLSWLMRLATFLLSSFHMHLNLLELSPIPFFHFVQS